MKYYSYIQFEKLHFMIIFSLKVRIHTSYAVTHFVDKVGSFTLTYTKEFAIFLLQNGEYNIL